MSYIVTSTRGVYEQRQAAQDILSKVLEHTEPSYVVIGLHGKESII